MSIPPSTFKRLLGPLIARLPIRLASTSSFSNQALSAKCRFVSQVMRRIHSRNFEDGGFLLEGGKVKCPLDSVASPTNRGASAGPRKVARPLTSHWDASVRKRRRLASG